MGTVFGGVEIRRRTEAHRTPWLKVMEIMACLAVSGGVEVVVAVSTSLLLIDLFSLNEKRLLHICCLGASTNT